jgi:hypothetical protein
MPPRPGMPQGGYIKEENGLYVSTSVQVWEGYELSGERQCGQF